MDAADGADVQRSHGDHFQLGLALFRTDRDRIGDEQLFNALLHPRKSPVRIWTLTGALLGCVGGFWLAIGSAYVNQLYAGGKFTPTSYIPYCIVHFFVCFKKIE